MLVCGPSFGSGRYGYACGMLAREAARRGIPTVCGMDPESPGVAAAEGAAYIVPTSSNVAGMREALPRIAALAAPPRRRARSSGRRRTRATSRAGCAGTSTRARPAPAARSICCSPSSPATPAPRSRRPSIACRRRPPVADLAAAKLALVTEAGCVPQGNPDGLPTIRADAWLRYPARRRGDAGRRAATNPCTAASTSPPRTPTRTASFPSMSFELLQRRGQDRSAPRRVLHDHRATALPSPPPSKFGQEIADELKEAGVEAVVLSGT